MLIIIGLCFLAGLAVMLDRFVANSYKSQHVIQQSSTKKSKQQPKAQQKQKQK